MRPRPGIRAPRASRRRRFGRSRWILRLAPFAFVGSGLYLLIDAYDFTSRAVGAEGAVLPRDVSGAHDAAAPTFLHRPTIGFAAANGGRHVSRTHIASPTYDYAVGDRVRILYDPADPAEVRLDSFWSLWFVPSTLVLLGVLLHLVFNIFGVADARPARPAHPAPAPQTPRRAGRRVGRRSRYENQPPTVRR